MYGHKGNNTEAGKAESCPGVELLAPIGQASEANAQELIGSFEPTGWTPIGGALEAAGQAFAGKEGQSNRIIVISDGEETCDGDPVAVAQRLNQEGFNVQIDVVGFDLENQAVVEQMQAIAAAGGGIYYDARSRDQLRDYLDQQLEALYQTREAFVCNISLGSSVLNCDQAQVTAAADWLRNKANEVEDSDAQLAESLRALRSAVRDQYDIRLEQYKEAGRKSGELAELVRKMRDELNSSR